MNLNTARLILRPQQAADAPAMFAILSDPEAMRFWHRPAITRLAVAEELIGEQQQAMADGLCRYWTLVRAGEAIGSVDLSLIESGSAELGFLLRPDCWGMGLASEAAGVLEQATAPSPVSAINTAPARIERVLTRPSHRRPRRD